MSHSLTKTSASIKETPQPDPPPLTTYGENYALPLASDTIELSNGELVNASGHTQTLERKFNLWDMCATAIVVGDCWAAAGGSIVRFFFMILFYIKLPLSPFFLLYLYLGY